MWSERRRLLFSGIKLALSSLFGRQCNNHFSLRTSCQITMVRYLRTRSFIMGVQLNFHCSYYHFKPITPPSRSAAIWNTVRNHLSLNAFTFKPNTLKSLIKIAILNAQSEGEPMEWNITLNSLQQNSKILKLNLSTQENKWTITSSTGRK
jgi:hypothetical protein